MDKLEQIEKQKKIQTDKLIDAVLSLEKRFKKTEDQTTVGKVVSSISDSFKEKLKNAFSLSTAASAIGIKRGSFIGSLIEERQEKIKQDIKDKLSERKEARSFASGFAKYTDTGRNLAKTDRKAALLEGVKVYSKKKDLNSKIKAIETEIEEAKKLGSGADITPERRMELNSLTVELENLLRPEGKKISESVAAPRVQNQEPRNLKIDKITARDEVRPGDMFGTARVTDVITKADEEKKNPETFEERVLRMEKEQNLRKAQATMVSPEKGNDDPSLEIEKKQLTALETLVKNSQQSEEDLLESKIKNPVAITKKEQKEKKESTKGLLDSLGNIGAMLGGFIPALSGISSSFKLIGPVLGKLAGIALPAAGLAAAGIVGAGIGKYVVNPALDKGAQLLTGEKDATLGTALNSMVDGDVNAIQDKLQNIVLYKVKPGKKLTPDEKQFLSRNKDKMNPALRKIYDSMDKVSLKKKETTTRETLSQQLQSSSSEMIQIEKEKVVETSKAPTTNIQTNNTSNTNVRQTRITPPVRNIESSYNARFRESFS